MPPEQQRNAEHDSTFNEIQPEQQRPSPFVFCLGTAPYLLLCLG
jgi:hypothetical protein